MGTWSGEPFGNDTAADWAWELDESSDWGVVQSALSEVIGSAPDADVETIAIAAAEVVAHGLGRPTEDDPYTESVAAFLTRASAPDHDTVQLALDALTAATAPTSELSELWAESDGTEWAEANEKLRAALRA